MIFHDVEQNSDEWYQLRAGKLTGSSFGKIMANYGKPFGEPAKKLAVQIATERLLGRALSSDSYTNAHMGRGHEQEPVARMLYEDRTFKEVSSGGFFDCGNVGCSPDGLVTDGIIEIKSVIATQHYATLKRGSFDPAYKWQLISNMYYTGSQFIDFISYCADMPDDKKLFICTLTRDSFKSEIKQLEDRVEQFFKVVQESSELILNSETEVIL